MQFADQILSKIQHFIEKYDLCVIEHTNDYLKLKSNQVVVSIVHNLSENSNTVFLGREDEQHYSIEIDDDAMKNFFHSSFQLGHPSLEVFGNNLALFLENFGKFIFHGDAMLGRLEKFNQIRSQRYTKSILDSQNLTAADNAWREKNYKEFLKFIDRLNLEELPSAYKQKIKIARNKH